MAMLVITRGYVAKGCGDESGATEPNSEVPGTDDYIQKKRFFDWLWTFNVGRATCTWICFTGPCNKLGGAKGVKSNFKWSWLAMVKSNQDSPSSKSTKSQRIRRCPWGINKNTAGGRWPWKNRHVPWILGSQNFGLLPALWDNFLILFDCKLKTYIYIYIYKLEENGHLWAPDHSPFGFILVSLYRPFCSDILRPQRNHTNGCARQKKGFYGWGGPWVCRGMRQARRND